MQEATATRSLDTTTGEQLPLATTKERSREQQTAQSKLNKIIKKKKRLQYWPKDRHTNRKKLRVQKYTHIYSQLIHYKGAKTFQWEENSLQQVVLGQLNVHMQ